MARRVPIITRDQVAAEHTAAYDEITSIRGRPPVVGPTSVMIYSPEMALRANRLAEYLAEQSHLPEKIKRLAALIAARSMDCQFIWNAQAPAGRRAGLSDALVDALRDKKPLPAMPPDEAAVVNYGLELTATNKVSQETFQAALDQLGAQGLTEFTTSMGYFRMLALNANAFTIDLPEQRTEPLLPI
jgi:4-carboxymuconolactone decarboxylase